MPLSPELLRKKQADAIREVGTDHYFAVLFRDVVSDKNRLCFPNKMKTMSLAEEGFESGADDDVEAEARHLATVRLANFREAIEKGTLREGIPEGAEWYFKKTDELK